MLSAGREISWQGCSRLVENFPDMPSVNPVLPVLPGIAPINLDPQRKMDAERRSEAGSPPSVPQESSEYVRVSQTVHTTTTTITVIKRRRGRRAGKQVREREETRLRNFRERDIELANDLHVSPKAGPSFRDPGMSVAGDVLLPHVKESVHIEPSPIQQGVSFANPPREACFNCWRTGHGVDRGMVPQRHVFCIHCSKAKVRVDESPRCQEEYPRYLQRTAHLQDQKTLRSRPEVQGPPQNWQYKEPARHGPPKNWQYREPARHGPPQNWQYKEPARHGPPPPPAFGPPKANNFPPRVPPSATRDLVDERISNITSMCQSLANLSPEAIEILNWVLAPSRHES